MRKVYVVGVDQAIRQMFIRRGWEVVTNIDETTNLIQFTGGEDVDPSYYHQPRHPATRSNPTRDAYESGIFHEWKDKIPMAGICRGGQFLNVMNGGSIWQHVTDHAISGTHRAQCCLDEAPIEVTSTHHQMMIPGDRAAVLMTASVCQQKSSASTTEVGGDTLDVEAVFYPETASLCFQPHPEYVSFNHDCQDKYFEYIDTYLM